MKFNEERTEEYTWQLGYKLVLVCNAQKEIISAKKFKCACAMGRPIRN